MATLLELTERMRLRLGEVGVKRGSWDDRTEIKLALNVSQIELAKALYSRGESWAEKIGTRIPVEDGAEYYLCPDNYMIEERVGHFHPDWGYRKLIRGSVQDARLNRLDSTYAYSGSYGVYEIRGKTEVYLAIGTADLGSDDTTLLDYTADFSQVRVGDIVHNIFDGSQATVRDFTGGQIQVDDWRGGSSQRFYTGESYRIAQRERSAHQLWCYPPVQLSGNNVELNSLTFFNSPVFTSSSPSPVTSTIKNSASFVISEDVLVNAIQFQVGALPEDWEDDSVLAFYILDSNTNTVLESTSFGMQRIRLGYNTVPNLVPFRLQQGTTYNFVTFGGATISGLKLLKDNNNFVELNYTPLPAPMLYDNSICEFSDEWLEPLLDHSKILLMDKIFPKGEMFNQLVQRYEWSKDSSKEYKDKAAADNIEVVSGYGDNPTLHFGVQPGYTLNHGLVEL